MHRPINGASEKVMIFILRNQLDRLSESDLENAYKKVAEMKIVFEYWMKIMYNDTWEKFFP